MGAEMHMHIHRKSEDSLTILSSSLSSKSAMMREHRHHSKTFMICSSTVPRHIRSSSLHITLRKNLICCTPNPRSEPVQILSPNRNKTLAQILPKRRPSIHGSSDLPIRLSHSRAPDNIIHCPPAACPSPVPLSPPFSLSFILMRRAPSLLPWRRVAPMLTLRRRPTSLIPTLWRPTSLMTLRWRSTLAVHHVLSLAEVLSEAAD